MRTQNRTKVRHGRLATLGCILVLVLGTLGCSTSEPGAEHEELNEFSFPAPEPQDNECDGDCGPTTTDMCGMTKSGDVLAFVRVLKITEHRDTCEDRPYRHDYRDVEIEVLDIAAGDDSFVDANLYRDFLSSGAVKVGQPYIMKFSHFDGVWWNRGIIELTPTSDSTEVSPVDIEPEDDIGGTIYDLPTNRADFVAEADRVWNNYEEECDPEGRRRTDLDHMNSYIYGKSCRDSGPTPGVVNNDDGPVPGDDNYNAGD